ncbi:hypothetical protein [Rathayibacter sp. VKM Ac-2760]|uniref:hypothetical protein n=1 Tax=Rathayibacter sp. VKM Ac-2760 TaxID=2609253 RepID=UPI0013175896|nr:hypothetical protein [Rathayibacter sp. VKM Ac-2760]QHC58332.1 hypothetical protein GSU72_07060 [Rathayibacter sp. VKM Ac-2760]
MTAIEIRPAAATIPAGLLLPQERDERRVRCGPWSLRLADGRLDDIRFGSLVVLRGVRFVARDEDWGTFATVRAEAVVDGDALRIDGESQQGAAQLTWTLRVGFEDAALTVALEARAGTDFLRNRVGLVVLHPADLAGTAFQARHPDGSPENGAFPVAIAPHQPARDLAGLQWSTGGVRASVTLAGDVFETEDQRNWTDASFKTYSTPLDLPFPVAVAAGDVIRQTVRLECEGPVPTEAGAAAAGLVALRTGTEGEPLPEIRTGASSAPGGERPERLPALPLLIECDPRLSGWRAALHRALDDAQGRPADLRIVARTPDDVHLVLATLGDAPLARLGVFAALGHRSEPDLLEAARRAAAERRAELVGGVCSHFTELNRGAEALAAVDAALAFSLTSFMHDRSGHQLVESLAVQSTVVRDARALASGRRLHIGPITLGARMNAVSTSPFDPGDPDIDRAGYGPQHLAGATDPRQTEPALAAWLVGSLSALAVPSVDSLCYFEQWGPRGVDAGGAPTAAGAVLEWAAALAGAPRLEVEAPGLAALGAVVGARRVVLLGNLGGDAVPVAPAGVESWVSTAGAETPPFVLAPGAAARLVLAR